jgi:GNAT superfamily N-acetyltransferase
MVFQFQLEQTAVPVPGQHAVAGLQVNQYDTGDTLARCSLWWHGTPDYPGERVGLIGHYDACDGEAAAHLLHAACAELAAQGCTLAVGPLDGSTWRRYRLVTERGSEPPFFLEPDNQDDWPAHFLANGFSTLARYSSALNPELSRTAARGERAAARLEARGIRLRAVQPAEVAAPGRFVAVLRGIYRVAVAAFRANLLYSPISEADFIAQYLPIRPSVRPELVLLAEREGEVIGFVFGLPDALQAQRGQPIDTVIIKTVAVLPAYAGQGIGALLVERCQAAAARLGYRRAIHALMHEGNASQQISAHSAQTMRRYALFARWL